VAAEGFQAPGVVVSYTTDPASRTARSSSPRRPADRRRRAAACDEPADFRSFRVGLFGLDKLQNVERTVQNFKAALDKVE
jgi:aspartate aminotransferase-like enzyme